MMIFSGSEESTILKLPVAMLSSGTTWMSSGFEDLVGQADFADQFGEPGVGADGIELEVGI